MASVPSSACAQKAKQLTFYCHLITFTLHVKPLFMLFFFSNAPKWKIQDLHERIWISLLKIWQFMVLPNDRMPQHPFPRRFYGHQWCPRCLCCRRPTSELALRKMSLDHLRYLHPKMTCFANETQLECLRSICFGVLTGGWDGHATNHLSSLALVRSPHCRKASQSHRRIFGHLTCHASQHTGSLNIM